MFDTLRRSRPAPTVSAMPPVICATTSAPRSHDARGPLAPFFSAGTTSRRVACSAGTNPNTRTVPTDTTTANMTAAPSISSVKFAGWPSVLKA